MQRLAPLDYVVKNSFVLKVGEERYIEELRASFIAHGYLQVEQTSIVEAITH